MVDYSGYRLAGTAVLVAPADGTRDAAATCNYPQPTRRPLSRFRVTTRGHVGTNRRSSPAPNSIMECACPHMDVGGSRAHALGELSFSDFTTLSL